MSDIVLDAKKTGMILIIISIALIAIFAASTKQLMNSQDTECSQVCGINMETDGKSCPHENSFPLESYAGFSISLAIAGIGISMILKNRAFKEGAKNERQTFDKKINSLTDEEKRIYAIIRDSNGAIFQGEVTDKSGFTKVKVSRILDRLEGQGIIERRRHGMSNMVVLKK